MIPIQFYPKSHSKPKRNISHKIRQRSLTMGINNNWKKKIDTNNRLNSCWGQQKTAKINWKTNQTSQNEINIISKTLGIKNMNQNINKNQKRNKTNFGTISCRGKQIPMLNLSNHHKLISNSKYCCLRRNTTDDYDLLNSQQNLIDKTFLKDKQQIKHQKKKYLDLINYNSKHNKDIIIKGWQIVQITQDWVF